MIQAITASQNNHDFKEQVTDNKSAVWADTELWCVSIK